MSGRRLRLVLSGSSSRPAQAAIEAAFELAARLEAELESLFVEELDLLRSAELPFVRQVSGLTAAGEPFDLATTQRELRSLARRLEQAMGLVARRQSVKHSFRVVRGSLPGEVSSAASESDILLLPDTSARHGRQLVVLADGSQLAPLLQLARRLAERQQTPIQVLVADPADIPRVAPELPGTELRFRVLPGLGPATLRRTLREAGAGLLLIAADNPLVAEPGFAALCQQVSCPVLVVRAGEAG